MTIEEPGLTIKAVYRRPKFLEVLLDIRQEMAREADYDVDLFAEMVRVGAAAENKKIHSLTEAETKGKKIDKKKDLNRKL